MSLYTDARPILSALAISVAPMPSAFTARIRASSLSVRVGRQSGLIRYSGLMVIRQVDMRNQYYWNKENFEGLTSLSLELQTDSRLERLARYCDLREKGLRRQALAELRAFIEQARSSDVSAQRAAATRILDAHWRMPQARWLLTEPMRKFL